MDNQILRDLFTQCIESAKILGIDDELNSQIRCGERETSSDTDRIERHADGVGSGV